MLRSRIVTIPAADPCTSGVFTAGATYIAGGFNSYQMVSAALPASPPIAVAANGGSEVHVLHRAQHRHGHRAGDLPGHRRDGDLDRHRTVDVTP